MPEEVNLHARVATLDAQVQSIMRNLDGLDKLFPSIRDSADIEQKVAILENEVIVIQAKLDKKIDRNEFWPVRAIAYGLAATVLLAVAAAVLKGLLPPIGIVHS